ncbi:hypothetical protein R75461_07971 [Paraburkholderia nemoris]|nr:hypothetical protein R75461_07971 [Paraburkholderia nemoris]
MKKQITTAGALAGLLAIACLLWEQQSAAALSGTTGAATRASRTSPPSPFEGRLRFAGVVVGRLRG